MVPGANPAMRLFPLRVGALRAQGWAFVAGVEAKATFKNLWEATFTLVPPWPEPTGMPTLGTLGNADQSGITRSPATPIAVFHFGSEQYNWSILAPREWRATV